MCKCATWEKFFLPKPLPASAASLCSSAGQMGKARAELEGWKADMLAELEDALRSNEKEKITLEEELVLQRCKSRAANTFLTTAGISSALVWGATKNRFNTILRTSFSIGAALFSGVWMCERSLHSSVLSIAAAHGTRMQRELSNIIMTKNLHNPASPINKVFYPEHVYDDSSQEKPLIRWRIRSFYEETVAADSLNDTTSSKTLPSGSEPKERTRNPSGDASTGLGDLISDPLDCIFGYPEEGGETLHSDKAVVSRRALRAYKRQQRRHHARHHKNSAEHASTEILTI